MLDEDGSGSLTEEEFNEDGRDGIGLCGCLWWEKTGWMDLRRK